MTLNDIYRFAADNGVTISFRAIDHSYMPPTLEIVVQKEDFRTADRVKPGDLDDEDFIKYIMDHLEYKIKKYLEIHGNRLCANCGNRMCKDAYPCGPIKESIRDCINNGRKNWVPITEKKEKQNE